MFMVQINIHYKKQTDNNTALSEIVYSKAVT